MNDQDVARLWSKIDRSGGPESCWPWTGARFTTGYGMLGVAGRTRHANRLVMEVTLGRPLARDEWALHSCDNRPCCNPAHLHIGTPRDNAREASVRGRLLTGDRHPMRRPGARIVLPMLTGERHPKARLTDAIVREARMRHAEGESASALAREFGVTPQSMDAVVKRRTWRAVGW